MRGERELRLRVLAGRSSGVTLAAFVALSPALRERALEIVAECERLREEGGRGPRFRRFGSVTVCGRWREGEYRWTIMTPPQPPEPAEVCPYALGVALAGEPGG